MERMERWTRRNFIDTAIVLWCLLGLAGCAIAWGWMEMKRMEMGVSA